MTTLPKVTLAALPSAAKVARQIDALSESVDALFQDADQRKNSDAITMARVMVVLHRLNDKMEELHRSSSTLGKFGKAYETFRKETMPHILEAAGVTHVPLSEGFRVGMSSQVFASIKPGQKTAAYDWLRSNGLGDLITDTVNSSTLSAALRKKIEDDNEEPPADLFGMAIINNTSVTTLK